MKHPISPTNISIPLPDTYPVKGKGVFATTAPHGFRVNVHYSKVEHQLIELARGYISSELTNSGFVRQVAVASAIQIIQLFESGNPLVEQYLNNMKAQKEKS